MDNYKLYAAGEFIDTGEYLKVKDPYTQIEFAQVAIADQALIERAVQAGLAAESAMKQAPVYQRSGWLHAIAEIIEAHLQELALLITKESGKPIRYAKAEVKRTIQTYRIAAEECKRIPGELLSLDWTPTGLNKEGWVRRFPAGLVLGIAPFNFPLNLTAHKIGPSLAAGNPIILKPSSKTPVAILRLAELIGHLDIPVGGFQVIPMGRTLGNQLAVDERIKVLSFTGSPAVGWDLKARAGKKKVLLELGGNAGVYVGDSADLPTAVSKCIAGAFAYSGQVCIHLQRIFVHEQVMNAFQDAFVQAAGKLSVGPSSEEETDISAMIDEENAIRIEHWVSEAVSLGAKILFGGKRDGAYFPPTVLTQTNNSMKVCALEAFGPVVTLEAVKSFESGIDCINDSQFGLQAGLFTNRLDEMDRAFDQLDVGGVIVNDIPTFRVDHMPYGGVKNSGFGREGIRYAIMEMTEPKLLIKSK